MTLLLQRATAPGAVTHLLPHPLIHSINIYEENPECCARVGGWPNILWGQQTPSPASGGSQPGGWGGGSAKGQTGPVLHGRLRAGTPAGQGSTESTPNPARWAVAGGGQVKWSPGWDPKCGRWTGSKVLAQSGAAGTVSAALRLREGPRAVKVKPAGRLGWGR